jgi:hypothetical protein
VPSPAADADAASAVQNTSLMKRVAVNSNSQAHLLLSVTGQMLASLL